MRQTSTSPVAEQELLSRLAHRLLHPSPNHDGPSDANVQKTVDDALRILPKLRSGIDVNVFFHHVRSFEYTDEISTFDLCAIPLLHGWVVDPEKEREVALAMGGKSYNTLITAVLGDGDSKDGPSLVESDWESGQGPGPGPGPGPGGSSWSPRDRSASLALVRAWLEMHSSQLTTYGLAQLREEMGEGTYAVLFHNNHFSAVTKYKGDIYALVTDEGT